MKTAKEEVLELIVSKIKSNAVRLEGANKADGSLDKIVKELQNQMDVLLETYPRIAELTVSDFWVISIEIEKMIYEGLEIENGKLLETGSDILKQIKNFESVSGIKTPPPFTQN